MKIAVCMHLYYTDMYTLLKKYLQNFKENKFDLYVTLPYENRHIEEDVRKDYPDTIFIYTQNVGFDIYPFLQFLQHIDLEKYDIIFKIHTKKDIPVDTIINGYSMKGDTWRRFLLDAIIGSSERIQEIIDLFEKDSKIGMVCSKELIMRDEQIDRDIDMRCVMHVLAQCGLELKEKEFIAGTMFAFRPQLMKPFRRRNYIAEEFPPYFPRDWNGLPYCLERCFSCAISSQGYTMYGISSNPSTEVVDYSQACMTKIRFKEKLKKALPNGVVNILKSINAKTLKW